MRQLTDEDLDSIVYFYEEKSVERYCDWEDVKADFALRFPHVMKAMTDLEIAQKTLDILMKDINNETID